MSQKDMTIYDHIDELRKRLVIIVVFFVFAVIASFFLRSRLLSLFKMRMQLKKLQ